MIPCQVELGPMTLRRIFPNTTPAASLETARLRALSLYREWLREVRGTT